jgi:hypothetical protein
MARAASTFVSAGGFILGVATLMLWAWATTLRRLDALALLLFSLGLALSIVGYARGADLRARRIGVVGIGCNAIGFVIVMLPYAVG